MSDCQRCELLRKMAADLLSERDEARAIAHERGLDAGELETQNRRLQEELEIAGAAAGAAVNGMEAENRRLREGLTDMYKLLKEQVAQNAKLQDELEKAKAELGARNRILTEEP